MYCKNQGIDINSVGPAESGKGEEIAVLWPGMIQMELVRRIASKCDASKGLRTTQENLQSIKRDTVKLFSKFGRESQGTASSSGGGRNGGSGSCDKNGAVPQRRGNQQMCRDHWGTGGRKPGRTARGGGRVGRNTSRYCVNGRKK